MNITGLLDRGVSSKFNNYPLRVKNVPLEDNFPADYIK
jgi:hypothetical protein